MNRELTNTQAVNQALTFKQYAKPFHTTTDIETSTDYTDVNLNIYVEGKLITTFRVATADDARETTIAKAERLEATLVKALTKANIAIA